jgi:hypothetical protein
MTVAMARKANIRVDEAIAKAQVKAVAAYVESNRERYLQDISIPGGVDTTGYILLGLAVENHPPDTATDAMARYLKTRQSGNGSWRILARRPPLEVSDFQVTATALRVLQVYAPQSYREQYQKSVRLAADWLRRAEPMTNEDRAFRLLGLKWASADSAAIQKAGADLMERQRADGGWAQISTLSSDAYATGQTLVALAESGALKPDSRIYRRAVEYLIKTQLEDGSWYVRSRSIPFQPYFESDFPHGRDQFISAAATNWATMALTFVR